LCKKPGRGAAPGFLLSKTVPFSAEGESVQFQKDQSGKAAGAGRAIVQACAHDRLKERRLGDRKLRATRGFAVFSLFGSVIFSRIRGFTGLYMDFPIRPAPLYRDLQTGVGALHPLAETRNLGTCCVCCC
jgi:hypothetical protein